MTPLDKFGKFVVEHLRDRPLDQLEQLLKGRMKAPSLRKLQAVLRELDDETAAVVRDCVESILSTALHDFLFALSETNDLRGDTIVTVDGVNVAAESDGLQGEPYGERGWIARFSRHPVA